MFIYSESSKRILERTEKSFIPLNEFNSVLTHSCFFSFKSEPCICTHLTLGVQIQHQHEDPLALCAWHVAHTRRCSRLQFRVHAAFYICNCVPWAPIPHLLSHCLSNSNSGYFQISTSTFQIQVLFFFFSVPFIHGSNLSWLTYVIGPVGQTV